MFCSDGSEFSGVVKLDHPGSRVRVGVKVGVFVVSVRRPVSWYRSDGGDAGSGADGVVNLIAVTAVILTVGGGGDCY